jgi:cytoskeletal protein CcmA (bactofilin family)
VWNKRTEETPSARPPAAPIRPQPVESSVPPPQPDRGSAVIGAFMRIKGEIHSREELVVDGEVEGIVESHSSLTVGPNGKVKANIKAREVVIFGTVKGNVEVSEKIAIREQGSLVGDIKTAGISIDDGAYFKGSIDIVRPEPARSQKPAEVHEPSAAAR